MTLQYQLDENDLLQCHLFVASKSDRIKSQRIKSCLIYSVAFLLLSLLFYQSHNMWLTYYFLIFGFLWLCFYPLYQKWFYKRYYKRIIAETKTGKINQTANVSFTNDHIETNDITGESKINLTELEKVTETGE